MAEQLTNYQCPNCSGPLKFSHETGQVICEYCDTSYPIAEIEELYGGKDAAAAQAAAEEKPAPEGSHWSDAERAGLKVYGCPSCGAELICDETTAATSCPYCGNPTIVPAQLGGSLKPDYVIPFRLGKDEAVAALKKHYSRKPLLPGLFSAQNHIEEIKGVYVPFWIFNGTAKGSVIYKGEKTRSYRQGRDMVRETDHFELLRGGSVLFTGIPTDGSSKMPNEHMEAIEPYDMRELVPFSTAFLPGYYADKYDVDQNAALPRIEARAIASAEDLFRSSVEGFSGVTVSSKELSFEPEGVSYAMLPVWLLSTQWNGKNFLFAMNGQTGKLIGDLPISKKRVFSWLFGLWGGVSLLLLLLMLLF